MTRETKLGLLIGTGIILLIGIVVSDHLSVVKKQDPAVLNTFAPEAQESLSPLPPASVDQGSAAHGLDVQPGVVDSSGGIKSIHSPGASVGTAGYPTVPQTGVVPVGPRVSPTGTMPMMGEPVPAFSTSPIGAGVQGASSGQPSNHLAAVDRSGNAQIGLFDQPAASSTHDGFTGASQAGNNQVGNSGSVDGLIPDRNDSFTSRVQETTHQVKPGESLWDIAKLYYGDGSKWGLIAGANPKSVGRKGEVHEGTKLVIPDRPGNPRDGSRQSVSSSGGGVQSGVESSGKTIKVQSGDTLERLAKAHLGSGQRWNELFKANSDQLRRPEDLQVGMNLRLPRAEASADRPVSSAVQGGAGSARNAGARTYVVQQGDTLSDIAKKTLGKSSRWKEILQANKAALKGRPQDLKIGQELVIPSNESSSPASTNSRGRLSSQQQDVIPAKLNGDNHREELLLLEIPTSQPAAQPVTPRKS